MSLSKPAAPRATNPATKYIEWKGSRTQGFFQYYDKSEEDKSKRNKTADLSKGFVVLDGIDDKLFSITGYNEALRCNLISNEVRTMKDLIVVKQYVDGKASVVLQGTYEELKDTVKESRNYEYTQCFYLFFEGELVHLKLKGAGLRQWFTDVQPNMNAASSFISHSETKDGIKGAVEYKYPCWSVLEKIDQETLDAAIECDSKILQPYLNTYFAKNPASKQEPVQDVQEEINTSEWRKAESDSGIQLCKFSYKELSELQDSLIESGKHTVLLDYVGHAIFDYQNASKQWMNQKSKADGRTLDEFSVEEINVALGKISPLHPSRIFLECALSHKLDNQESSFNDEDDIPF